MCTSLEVVITTAATATARLFQLTTGRETVTVHGRASAVARAKELSQSSRRPVSVESSDGSVKMQFSNGGLETYRMETSRH